MKVPKLAIHELDIGHAFRERHARQQRSWSRLNVSELSGPILLERNPDARCLCWKLLLLVPPGSMESLTNNLTSKWLLKKLMGSGNEDGGLIFLQQAYQFGLSGSVLQAHVVYLLSGPVISKSSVMISLTVQAV